MNDTSIPTMGAIMKEQSMFRAVRRLLISCVAIVALVPCLMLLGVAGKGLLAETAAAQEKAGPNYSPYANRSYATRVYWGDQHLHTSFSPDAGLVGDRLSPDDAFRFARGEQLRSSSGQLVQLGRPYDWLVVDDHAEYLCLPEGFADQNDDILDRKRV